MGGKGLVVITAQKSQSRCGIIGDEWETSGVTSPFGVVDRTDRYQATREWDRKPPGTSQPIFSQSGTKSYRDPDLKAPAGSILRPVLSPRYEAMSLSPSDLFVQSLVIQFNH